MHLLHVPSTTLDICTQCDGHLLLYCDSIQWGDAANLFGSCDYTGWASTTMRPNCTHYLNNTHGEGHPLGFSPPQSSYYRLGFLCFGPAKWALTQPAIMLVAGVG